MQQDLSKLSDDLHGTSQNLNALLIQAGLTADQARLAAQEQRAYWAKNSLETHKLLTHADEMVKHLDQISVIVGMDLHEQVSRNGAGLTANLVDLQTGIRNISNAADDLDRTVLHLNSSMYQADPFVTATLTNLNVTSANISSTSENVAATSKDIRDKVHQLTRPAKWYMAVGGMVLETGAKIGSWVAGFFK